MSNIDEKTIAGLLGRIDAIKNELTLLEDQIRSLSEVEGPAVDAGEPSGPGRVHSRSAAAEYGLGPEATPAAAVQELPVTMGEDIPVILSEAKDLSEAVEPPELAPVVHEPAEEPEEEPIDIAPVDDTPIDISISDVEDLPADAGEPSEPGRVHSRFAAAEYGLGSEAAPAETIEPKKAILDTAKADTAVMDVMAEKQSWRTDRPGMPVKNIISAISLNDRVFLINTLFGEDPMLFQETISKFNAMGSLSEALAYIGEKHPDWDMNSDAVYRLMMAVRRKLS